MSINPPAHPLDAVAIARDLGTRRVGRRIEVLPEVDSTNAYALDRLAPLQAAADGTVVFAEHQTAGRGRLGRAWVCPRGAGLLFTVFLWQSSRPASLPRLVMASAVAVAIGVERATDVEPVIRWPNDLYVGDRKLAGMLVEVRDAAPAGAAVAVGIGINCFQQAGHFPPDLAASSTSLEIESTQALDRPALARTILREFDRWLSDSDDVSDSAMAAKWSEHSADIGARVTLVEDGRAYPGRIVDVSPVEGLLLHLDSGGRRHFDPAKTSRRSAHV